MLTLDDFLSLPRMAPLIEQVLHDSPGLVVVAGLGPRPLTSVPQAMLASGRSTIFRTLFFAMLQAQPHRSAIIVSADRALIRVASALKRRVRMVAAKAGQDHAALIAAAAAQRPDLLVVDRLDAHTAPAALAAAHDGIRVLSQLDTVLRGAALARQIGEMGVDAAHLPGMRWLLAVQRMATLCPNCKQPIEARDSQRDLLERYGLARTATLFHASGCAACSGTGRAGDVSAFDVFRADAAPPALFEQPSVLPLAAYVAELAANGTLPIDDALQLDADQVRRAYQLLAASEAALAHSNAALERKLAELEAANQVLQQRTTAVISLQSFSEALIGSAALDDLVQQVCHMACRVCDADRAILYLNHAERAEVLAVWGWPASLLHQQIDQALLCDIAPGEPASHPDWPPGIPPRHADVEGAELRAGLCVALHAENAQVGVMVVHSTRKARFTPSEKALLQTFANQAALSIQRARLIEQLREKVEQLQAAQATIVAQERLARELELARQVQQSVLPRRFPQVPGFAFAAGNEPARQVGGDLYDIFMRDAEHFGVVIADVSGKGMPAALYMGLVRSLLLAEARRDPSPRAVLLNVNRLLRELGDPHMFVTVFYGVVEIATRRLTYARAGHDYPLLIRDGAATLLQSPGTLLGALDERELRLDEACLALQPGDRLVLYTDGLTDILNEHNQRFDLEQLTAVVLRHAQQPSEAICSAVFADLAAYQGSAEQYDDMTMLAITVDPRP